MSKTRRLSGRRRSKSLGVLATNDICKTIDKSLPSSSRLQLLIQYALETTLSKVTKELSEDIDFDAFTKSVSECQVNIQSALETQNLYAVAVSNDELTNVGISVNNKYAGYCVAVEKLNDENKQWDQLKTKCREELENEKNLTDIPITASLDCKGYELPSYSNIMKDVSNINGSLSLQLEKFKGNRQRFKGCVKFTEKIISTVNAQTERHFEKIIKESPKALIRKCI